MLEQVHPVLFHIGFLLIPSYGAVAALGVVLSLLLAQRTARTVRIDPNKIWNLCILVLFTAIVGSRLLLVIANWSILRNHPVWMLGLAMIHHPLIAGIGSIIALVVGAVFARWQHLPFRATADALAAPLALGLAFEQAGALLAGSGYGTGTHLPWAVTYNDPLAERWSGAPLGIPVHPVQAYAAICFLLIALALLYWLPIRGQSGDVAGIFLLATGVTLYLTEFWRDPIGRGSLFHGILKGPQAAGIVLVLAAALILLERTSQRIAHPTAIAADERPVTNPNGQSNVNLERPTHG